MKRTTCNMCGKEFDLWDEQENFSIYTNCGYGTKYDMDRIELDLCCNCMEAIVEACEVSPVVSSLRGRETT